MNNSKIKPYLAFIFLCFAYGTSSALVSIIRNKVDPNVISGIRMFFGLLTSIIVFLVYVIKDHNYLRHARQSISSRSTNVPKAIFCGIISYGLPYSLMAISQRSVPTIAIQISQPIVPIFSLIIGQFLLPNEKCTTKTIFYQIVSVFGTLLSAIPTLKFSESKGTSYLLDYFLLFISIVLFGFGAVYLKYSQSNADQIVLCVSQLFGAFIYSTLYGIYNFGFSQFCFQMANVDYQSLLLIFILGTFYTCLPSILFFYVLKELGIVVSNYTNVGQIVIGMLTGIIFLDEWKNYNIADILMSIVGFIILLISIVFGLKNEAKPTQEDLAPLLQKK